jgi:hypothetical protein
MLYPPHHNHRKRNSRAFSLVTVSALGAVSMMWLFAVSAAVLPMYQRAAAGRFQIVARSAAEAGLDYAVAELNAAVAAGVTSPIDDTTQDNLPKISTAPDAAIGNNGAQVTISVNNVPAPAWSASYNELKDASDPDSPFFGQANLWRSVMATASYAGITRRIMVVLEPIATATTTPEGGSTGTTTTPQPYFRYAMFGRSTITMTGNARTDGYDSRTGPYGGTNVKPTAGDVGTNGSAALSGNTVVGGDLMVFSSPPGSTTSVVAVGSNTVTINDQLVVNGVETGFTGTPGGAALPGDNVLGLDRPFPVDPTYQPILESQTNTAPDFPPAPSAPDGAVNLGSISITGTTTLRIPPGDYKVNSISVSANAKILLVPDASGNYGPVRFFVEGSSSGSSVIQLTGSAIVNPTTVPGNLQVWYNGSKGVLMAGNSNFYGVLYAPNSDIKIAGNGTYYGALLGNSVLNTGNGAIHFDTALKEAGGTWGLTYVNSSTQAQGGSGVTVLFNGYRTISWKEL